MYVEENIYSSFALSIFFIINPSNRPYIITEVKKDRKSEYLYSNSM